MTDLQASRLTLRDGVGVNLVDAGEGPAVVFLHGITATLGYYRENLPFFARTHRVVAIDLPGFGRSDKPDIGYDMAYFAGVVEEILDRKGIERATLVGNSMGGLISMLFALRNPGRIDRLVLVDPAGITAYPRRLMLLGVQLLRILRVVDRPASLEDGAEQWERALLSPPRVPSEAVTLLFRLVFPDQPEIAARYIRAYVAAVSSDEYPNHLRATLRAGVSVLRHHVGERAAEIGAPTLIVWGARDRLLPVGGAHVLRSLIAGSRLIIYSQSGHCPMVDQPDRFNADVGRFLRGEEVGR
jgi:pimeloyl-ACP methyl ester carboxylesterase